MSGYQDFSEVKADTLRRLDRIASDAEFLIRHRPCCPGFTTASAECSTCAADYARFIEISRAWQQVRSSDDDREIAAVYLKAVSQVAGVALAGVSA